MTHLKDKMNIAETAYEASTGQAWCGPAKASVLDTAAAMYRGSPAPEYWMHALMVSNPAKCSAVVRAMAGELTGHRFAQIAAGSDLADLATWYQAAKNGGKLSTLDVVAGRAALFIQNVDIGKGNELRLNGFVAVWLQAMGGSKQAAAGSFYAWVRPGQVTEAQFCNGHQ